MKKRKNNETKLFLVSLPRAIINQNRVLPPQLHLSYAKETFKAKHPTGPGNSEHKHILGLQLMVKAYSRKRNGPNEVKPKCH